MTHGIQCVLITAFIPFYFSIFFLFQPEKNIHIDRFHVIFLFYSSSVFYVYKLIFFPFISLSNNRVLHFDKMRGASGKRQQKQKQKIKNKNTEKATEKRWNMVSREWRALSLGLLNHVDFHKLKIIESEHMCACVWNVNPCILKFMNRNFSDFEIIHRFTICFITGAIMKKTAATAAIMYYCYIYT